MCRKKSSDQKQSKVALFLDRPGILSGKTRPNLFLCKRFENNMLMTTGNKATKCIHGHRNAAWEVQHTSGHHHMETCWLLRPMTLDQGPPGMDQHCWVLPLFKMSYVWPEWEEWVAPYLFLWKHTGLLLFTVPPPQMKTTLPQVSCKCTVFLWRCSQFKHCLRREALLCLAPYLSSYFLLRAHGFRKVLVSLGCCCCCLFWVWGHTQLSSGTIPGSVLRSDPWWRVKIEEQMWSWEISTQMSYVWGKYLNVCTISPAQDFISLFRSIFSPPSEHNYWGLKWHSCCPGEYLNQ